METIFTDQLTSIRKELKQRISKEMRTLKRIEVTSDNEYFMCRFFDAIGPGIIPDGSDDECDAVYPWVEAVTYERRASLTKGIYEGVIVTLHNDADDSCVEVPIDSCYLGVEDLDALLGGITAYREAVDRKEIIPIC